MRIHDYLEQPESTAQDNFIAKVDEDKPERLRRSLRDFVVGEKVYPRLDDMLAAVGARLDDNRDVGRFIYGSFGSGKSHLLTVLGKMLERDAEVYDLGHKALRQLRATHTWLDRHRTLVVRLNMMGKRGLTSALFEAFNDALPKGAERLVFTDEERIFKLIESDARRHGSLDTLLEQIAKEQDKELGALKNLLIEKLMKLVERRISDRRVLKLLRQWLTAGVMEDGVVTNPSRGTPQGGVISPLLSNIYLSVLDTVWEKRCAHLGVLVRYADDFVVLCKTKRDVDEAEGRVKHVLTRLGLELHPEKTRKVDLSWGKEGFDFLGCHLQKRMSGPIWEREGRRVYFLQRWPSARAMKRVRQRVKELTPRSRCHEDLRETIARLNPVLRGWGGYFKTGNAAVKFNQLDGYVYRRLRTLRLKRAGSRLKAGACEKWTRDYFTEGFGLHRLRGTVQYPEVA